MLAAFALAALALAAPQTHTPVREPAAPETRGSSPAPDFELSDVAGEPFTLSRAWAEGWVLIAVVRGMW